MMDPIILKDPERLEKVIRSFECQRCTECCRQSGFVYLRAQEADACAKHLGMSVFDFVNDYCELQDRQKLVLKKKADEECILLKDGGCRVHSVKPKQCADFPTRWRTEESFQYCMGMKALFKAEEPNV